jgi:ribokinase
MIAVVGSANLDLTVAVDHPPALGETVLGGDHRRAPGGKGANQAVACARLGQRVALVGRVGADQPGAELRAALAAEGVDLTWVREDADAPTGLALITVVPGGDNAIVVSPGANGRVGNADVEAARELVRDAAVTLVQQEIPPEAVAAAVAAAGGRVVLNPAPAREIGAETLRRVGVLVPNRGELAMLAGREGEPEDLARAIDGPHAVVVTLGADGALVVEGERAERVAAPHVEAVDATGAGDTFCGALADALARGAAVAEAAEWAVQAAALSVTKPGAQSGMPTRDELTSRSARSPER